LKLIADDPNSVLPVPQPTEVFACQKAALDTGNAIPESERFIRTHHPCFVDAADVYVYEHPEYDPIWVVDSEASSTAKWLRVAGREVHVHHPSNIVPRALSPNFMEDLILHTINTGKLLEDSDLDTIRAWFPEVDGVRVHISGFITLLLSSDRSLTKLLFRPLPTTIGGLRVEISLLKMLSTSTPVHWGLGRHHSQDTERIPVHQHVPGVAH
jgi:hypothetical protein